MDAILARVATRNIGIGLDSYVVLWSILEQRIFIFHPRFDRPLLRISTTVSIPPSTGG